MKGECNMEDKSKNKVITLLSLFTAFFKIGAFTFGGGYAMIPLIHKEVVEKNKWIKNEELLDIIAVAESTPGPVAVNSATFVGYKIGKVLGSIAATLGVVLPSFLVIFIISFFYEQFMQIELVGYAFNGITAAVTVLIASAAFKLSKSLRKDWFSAILFAISLIVSVLNKTEIINFSPIYSILIGAVIGFIYYNWIRKGVDFE